MVLEYKSLIFLMLIMARIGGLFTTMPIFDQRIIPRFVKTNLVILSSFLLWFVVPQNAELLPVDIFTLLLALFSEFLMGAIVGQVMGVVFISVEAAGGFMSSQMGLSVATIMDPATGKQSTIIINFFRLIMTTLFFVMDGHHFLLSVMFRSFDILPVLSPRNISLASEHLVLMGSMIFSIGIQLAAPVVLTIFLLDFSFGLVSRVAPQVNVFMLGFQMKPSLGSLILLMMTPLLVERVLYLITLMLEKLVEMFFYLGAAI